VKPHPEAMALLAARYKPGDFNESRQRMARVPEGASLIKNPISVAPGFQIGNVFVLAGGTQDHGRDARGCGPKAGPGRGGHRAQRHGQAGGGADRRSPRRHTKVASGGQCWKLSILRRSGRACRYHTCDQRKDGFEVETAEREIVQLALSLGVTPEKTRDSR